MLGNDLPALDPRAEVDDLVSGCDPRRWRTSSYSGGNGGECVQVAAVPSAGRVLVRDSKDPDGPVLTIEPTDWRRFADHLKREPATL